MTANIFNGTHMFATVKRQESGACGWSETSSFNVVTKHNAHIHTYTHNTPVRPLFHIPVPSYTFTKQM